MIEKKFPFIIKKHIFPNKIYSQFSVNDENEDPNLLLDEQTCFERSYIIFLIFSN